MVIWRAANPGRIKASRVAYCAANKAKAKSQYASFYAKNFQKRKLYNAAWCADNAEARRINENNRRGRKIHNGGTLSKDIVAKLFKLQKGKCPCCRLPLGNNYHLDHKMPLALGGPNEDWNVQLLRQRCNNQKKTSHPVDFMQSKGFLL